MSGITKAKTRHDLDDEALGTYLAQHLPNLKLPVVSTKIGYGQSNPTYFVDDAHNTRFILRKKPAGTIISPVAHQVDREYRVIKALGSVEGFPVPRVYCLCEDDAIIGTSFYVSANLALITCNPIHPIVLYVMSANEAIWLIESQVMEFVKGRIITDPDLKDLSPTERRAAWFSLVSTLAWLHSIDPDSIGLEGYGKKTGFYTRHCNTFSRIEAQQAKVKDISTGKELGRAHSSFDEIVDYIRKNVPSDRASIVHGDYKFDNVILHPTEPRVIAILDWELSTIGHPLMDAVYVVGPYWNRASKAATGPTRDDMGGAVYDPENQRAAGMPSMDELVDEYARITGWDPRHDQWEIAKVFHLMRVSSSILQALI